MIPDKFKQLEKLSAPLEPSNKHFKKSSETIFRWAEKFLNDLDNYPAHYTQQKRKKLPGWKILMPESPGKSANLINLFVNQILTSGVNPASSGYVAYIPGGGVPWAALGDYIADISNVYSGAYFACPGAVELENRMISWMCHLLKFPATATGNITSGGSMANLIALVAARDKFKNTCNNLILKERENKENEVGFRFEKQEHFLHPKPTPIFAENRKLILHEYNSWVIYLSEQTHHSVEKSLNVIGLGEIVMRKIPLDKYFRMRTDILSDTIISDKSKGLNPWLILGNAGTTDTGACDDLMTLADISHEHNLWFHVDAAYGGFFLLTSQGRKMMKGIERADSVVMDPHKGLFLPYGIGAVLVRDKKFLMDSFQYQANYMHDTYREDEELYPALLSPELTRPFRAMRLWLTFHFSGMKAIKAALEEKILLARYFYKKIKNIPFIETPIPPDFSVVLFRYYDGINDPDEMTQKFLQRIREEKSFYISSTLIDGHFYLRLSVLCFRTHLRHIDKVIETLIEKGKELTM